MNVRNDRGGRPGRVPAICLTIVVVCLVPHLARSAYDVSQGMRVGSSYSTNSLSGAANSESIALGSGNYGSAPRTLAVGTSNYIGTMSGSGAIAVGAYNYLTGYNGFAFGQSNRMYGTDSAAFGVSNYVYGAYSAAIGLGNQTATGADCSLAAGSYTIAAGRLSTALGNSTTANSYASFVAGQWNAPLPGETDAASRTTWRPTDPLFVIGNGTSSGNRSNALVITKDGTVEIRRVKPLGGISTGSYTLP